MGTRVQLIERLSSKEFSFAMQVKKKKEDLTYQMFEANGEEGTREAGPNSEG
jgi:hypothetical protein